MEDYDEIFDLKPILPDMYTIISDIDTPTLPFPLQNSTIVANNLQQLVINSTHDQIPNPCFSSSSSSSNSAVDSTASKLISFANFNNTNQLGSATSTDGLPEVVVPPQPLQLAASSWDNNIILNFSSNSFAQEYAIHNEIQDDGDTISNIAKNVRVTSRDPLQSQEHVMAERKRREKLSQLFINLSKLVPGLKKLDKASLLEDAVNYLKTLQERVSVLEGQGDDRDQIQVKKSSSCVNYTIGGANVDLQDHDDRIINSPTNKDEINESSSPEIKARISNRNVLIKIWCNKEKGLMSRIPREMEKIHLSVMDMRVMPFGTATLDITILAEMQSEFCGTVQDIVEQLDRMLFFKPSDVQI